MSLSSIPDLRSLAVIIAVADAGSFGAAARQLDLSQQGVSERVKQAERTVGATLFHRTPQGAKPTPIGMAVIESGRDVLAAAEHLRDDIAWSKDPSHVVISCGASQTVMDYYLPHWIGRVRRNHPGFRFHLADGNSSRIAHHVAHGDYPIGFIESATVPHDHAAQLESAIVAVDTLVVATPPTHPWAHSTITAEDLRSTELIMREPGSGTRQVVDHALGRPLTSQQSLAECPSVGSVITAITALHAPAIVPLRAVTEAVAAQRLALCTVQDVTFTRPLRAIWRRGTTPRGGHRFLLDAARSFASRRPGAPTVR